MKKYLAILFFLIIADQSAKFVFLKNSICNKNLAWNIPIAPGVFYFLWLIIFFLLIYFFLKSKNYSERIALTFILSGAVSNLVDSIFRGCVIDFIDIKIWPIFNLADIYIAIGITMLFINLIKNKRPV